MSKPQRSADHHNPAFRLLTSIRDAASTLIFLPKPSVRCIGQPIFWTQIARDVGCLLDVDPLVISWPCLPMTLRDRNHRHVADFAVTRTTGGCFVDTFPFLGKRPSMDWTRAATLTLGYGYETHNEAEPRGNVALDNARDLLQYANYPVSLGDRLNILTLLDDHGPTPLSSCLQAVRSARDAVAIVAVLALRRFIEIDLYEGRISPETIAARFRR